MEASPGPGRFDFCFTAPYRRAGRLFGVTPQTAWVQIAESGLQARFGPWRLSTELENIASWTVTGPYRFWKTAGPARLGVTDRGLTFASNGRQGLLICFHRPVKGIESLGVIRHPELTVTVADPPGLAAALGQMVPLGKAGPSRPSHPIST